MRQKQSFVVNSTADATSTRVNVRVAVNSAAIRREQHNGREHIVVPSFTLPDGIVMNGGMYPKDEIDKAYEGLEGTLAPLSHPMVDGDYVSARQPEAINAYHVGAWNRNVKRVGNRVSIEKWIDVEFAKNSESGRALLSAIDKGEPIHTSTGIFLEREMTPNADGYGWIARNMQFDHDALLLNEDGAATPEDGVGMMVNKTFVINSVVVNEEENEISDKVEQYLVKNEESLFARFLERFKSVVQYPSTKTKPPVVANVIEESPDMTPEELQAALDAQAEKLQGAFNAALAALAAKNTEALTAVSAQLAANAELGLKDKRAAVAVVHGEVVANSLAGEALDVMFASVQTAAGLVAGAPVVNKDEYKVPSMDEHFGGAK